MALDSAGRTRALDSRELHEMGRGILAAGPTRDPAEAAEQLAVLEEWQRRRDRHASAGGDPLERCLLGAAIQFLREVVGRRHSGGPMADPFKTAAGGRPHPETTCETPTRPDWPPPRTSSGDPAA